MGTPCVNVPGLADRSGLPLGVQVIGRFGSDRATLEAALFVESALAAERDVDGLDFSLCGCNCPNMRCRRAVQHAAHLSRSRNNSS